LTLALTLVADASTLPVVDASTAADDAADADADADADAELADADALIEIAAAFMAASVRSRV